VHNGLEELARYIGSWRDTWSEHSFQVERIIDVGQRVVAVVRESGRGKSSGAPVTVRYGQLITVRDGKIVETVVYSDPEDAFDAAGRSR
jgi:ketosteroid isomerase-like protein